MEEKLEFRALLGVGARSGFALRAEPAHNGAELHRLDTDRYVYTLSIYLYVNHLCERHVKQAQEGETQQER
jgi:hypothetical protein